MSVPQEVAANRSFQRIAWWIVVSLGTAITIGVTSWISTTNNRLAHLEEQGIAIGREVSELRESQRAIEEMQRQIISSVREVRDDVKILIRGK